MEKRWQQREPDAQVVNDLHQSLNIHPILCRLLALRDINDYPSAFNFFRPSLEHLNDPFLMKDMSKAVNRIIKAFNAGEKIMIYGDYDVDGTTAVGCMYKFISGLHTNGETSFYIPHRYREGYGISKAGVDAAINEGINLVIALDCGIKSVDLIRYAKANGVDFIICDHHIPGDELPPAVAILNPKQKDCPYPYKELCGCGVGLKLIMAMTRELGLGEDQYTRFLDLAATAVAADIVPITGENRVIAFLGLKKANEDPSTALKALMKVSDLKGSITIQSLMFMIAPRVNAAGRMDDARKVVQLFVEDDLEKAIEFAGMLHADNADRKVEDHNITLEALSLLREYELLGKRMSTVVYHPEWHKGVVGIVASRLIEHYYRPTIVLTRSGDYVAGSARSIPGFNIHDGLDQCTDLLIGFGGHYFAAGMTMLPENVEAFREKFNSIVTATMDDSMMTPIIHIDAEIRLSDINETFYKIISQMEPFGPGNPQPIFMARDIVNIGHSRIVKEQHIRFVIKQDDITMSGIGFNMASKFDIVDSGQPFEMAFTIDENEWRGNRTLQVKVVDIRLAD